MCYYEYDNEFDGDGIIVNYPKNYKIAKDPSKHYPNKDEAKLLRKLMTENNMTEEEVRKVKKFRVALAEARSKGEKQLTSESTKYFKAILKKACQKTGLVPQHPDTMKVIDEILKERFGEGTYMWRKPLWMHYKKPEQYTAKRIVKEFAK